MMGKHPPEQPQLFYYNINLEKRVRTDHPLRKIKEMIDFDFVSEKVEPLYGTNGTYPCPHR